MNSITSSAMTSDLSSTPMTMATVAYSSTVLLSMSGTGNMDLIRLTHSTVVTSSPHSPTAANPSGGDTGVIIAVVVTVVLVVVGAVIVCAAVIAWIMSRRRGKSSYNVRSVFTRRIYDTPAGNSHSLPLILSVIQFLYYHNSNSTYSMYIVFAV